MFAVTKMWKEAALKEGEARAEARAEAEAEAREEKRLYAMLKILVDEGRMEDIERTAYDAEYCKALCKEFGLRD